MSAKKSPSRLELSRKQLKEAAHEKKTFLSIETYGSLELLAEVCQLTHLTRLNLYQVTELLPDIARLTNLEEFQISASPRLTALPPHIQELAKLRWLVVKSTSIVNLPDELAMLSSLNTLYLYDNFQLDYIPRQIGRLQNLELLCLNSNRHYDGKVRGPELVLPPSIGEISNLKTLQVDANNLVDLPSSFEGLHSLEKLSINFNFFQQIPEAVYTLSNLKELHLRGLPLNELKAQLGNLKKLTVLEADTAVLDKLPKSVRTLGAEAIVQYLAQGFTPAVRKSQYFRPSTENKKSLEKAQKFFQKVLDDNDYKKKEKSFIELEDFILYGSEEVPLADELLYSDVKKLPSVLGPFDQWNYIDRRIIEYITQQMWCVDDGDSGFYVAFYKWFKQELVTNKTNPNLFESVLDYLKQYGIDELEQLPERQIELLDCVTQGLELTSLGQFLLDQDESIFARLVDRGIKKDFLLPFAMHKNHLLLPHLERIISIDEYEGADGNRHIHFGLLQILSKYNAASVENIIAARLEEIDCVSCKCAVAKLLMDEYGNKYYHLAKGIAAQTITYLQERKKDKKYSFFWPIISNTEDSTEEFKAWVEQTFGY